MAWCKFWCSEIRVSELKVAAPGGAFGFTGEAGPAGAERKIGGLEVRPGRQFGHAKRIACKLPVTPGPLERGQACRHKFGHLFSQIAAFEEQNVLQNNAFRDSFAPIAGSGGLLPQGRGHLLFAFDRLSPVTIVPAFRAGPPARGRFPIPDDT